MAIQSAFEHETDEHRDLVEAARLIERLDTLPITTFHWRLLAFLGAGYYLDAIDVSVGGGILAVLQISHWSTASLNAWFLTATFSGMMAGAVVAGQAGDRFGRRLAFRVNLLVFGAATLVAATSSSMGWLIALRFVSGIGLGADAAIGYSVLAEFMPAKRRGTMLAVMSLSASIGISSGSLIALLLIPTVGWRGIFVVLGAFSLILWGFRGAIPESPRWLIQRGRRDEARSIVASIGATASRKLNQPVAKALAPVVPEETADSTIGFRLALASLLTVTTNITVWGVLIWLPSFFLQEGRSLHGSLILNMLIGAGAPIGTLLAICVVNRARRRTLVAAGCFASALLSIAFALAVSATERAVAGSALTASIYFGTTIGQAVYLPELFPTSYRLRSAAFYSVSGRVASLVAPFPILALFEILGLSAVLGFVAGLLVVQALLFTLFGPDTAGRPLNDAQ